MQVCIVEDDARLAGVLQQALEEEGSRSTHLGSGEQAASFITDHPFDTVVLDLMLPGTSGLEILAHLRRAKCQTPVLVLSARDTVPEIIRALDHGADDYLTKPFHLELFLARVRSLARRRAAPYTLILTKGPLMLDPTRHQVRVGEQPVKLTRREFMLLETLMRRAGQVVTRDQIAEAVWGHDADLSKGNLDYHIYSLRAKLGPVCEGMVQTMRGTGYMLANKGSGT